MSSEKIDNHKKMDPNEGVGKAQMVYGSLGDVLALHHNSYKKNKKHIHAGEQNLG